jgi:hypothetical protein
MSWDTKFDPNIKLNDTSKRVIGDKPYHEYSTTYQDYGDFARYQNFEKKMSMVDKMYNNFFDCYTTKNDDLVKDI